MANTIAVKDQSGALYDIPAENLQKAVAAGFSPATPDELQSSEMEKKYGGTTGELASAGLGAVGGATFGLGTQFLTKAGIIAPETVKSYKETNPNAYAAGEVAGVVGSSLLAPEMGLVGGAELLGKGAGAVVARALPEATTLVGKLATRGAAGFTRGAVEGSLYGVGSLVNEDALGDPVLNAEKIASTLGYSAAIGGGFSALISPIEMFFAKKSAEQVAKKSAAEAIAESKSAGPSTTTAGVAPKGVSDIENRISLAGDLGLEIPELPSKAILQDAEKVIGDSQFPVHEVQLRAMEDPHTLTTYKAVKESATPEGKALRDYEALQKAESVKKLNQTVDDLSPQKPLTADAYKAGEETIEAAHSSYKAKKIQDAEAFQALDAVAPNLRANSGDIVTAIQNSFPDKDLTGIISVGEDGVLKMKKYKSAMPISKEAWVAVRESIDNLEKGEITIEGLRNVRDAIGDKVFDLIGRPKSELTSLRKNLMDLIQGKVEQAVPDINVREMFKRYAINEGELSELEKILGGKLNDKQGLLRQVKPEVVGDRIFSNTANLQVARDILPKETFDRMFGNYLKEQVAKATDKGVFSSQKFSTWIKNNQDTLKIAFDKNPGALQKMNALVDKMRILPDAASHNPSGTAKAISLLDAITKVSSAAKGAGEFIQSPGKVIGGFLSSVGEKLEKHAELAHLEDVLAGGVESAKNVKKLAVVEKAVAKTTAQIKTMSNGILKITGKTVDVLPGIGVLLNQEDREKKFDKIQKELDDTNHPETLLDKLDKSTEAMYPAAPNISGAMQMTMTRATEFLKGKMPRTEKPGPLSPSIKPSDAEINKFFRFYNIVENPISVLQQVKDGVLTPEAMEAMSTVYPALLSDMQSNLMEKIAETKDATALPYQTKVMLSAFLGQDLISGMSQASIFANQASFAAPSQKQDSQEMAMMQKKPSQKGLESLTLSERSNTSTRSVIERKRS